MRALAYSIVVDTPANMMLLCENYHAQTKGKARNAKQQKKNETNRKENPMFSGKDVQVYVSLL